MGEHDHSFLQFRAVAAQHADPSGMEQSSEIEPISEDCSMPAGSTCCAATAWNCKIYPVYMKKRLRSHPLPVWFLRWHARHNALGSYDMTLTRSSGHWLFEEVESSLLRSFKLTRYLATLATICNADQNSVAATLITGSGDAWQPG